MDDVSRFVAEIQADIRDFERKLKRAQAQAAALQDEVEVEVDADISKFRRGLLQAEAMSRIFSRKKIEKNVVLNFKNARQNLRNFVTEVDNMNDNFQHELMRLAKMISAVGTVLGNMVRGTLVASFSALIPIIAGLTSAVMALGNAIGVTAGNLAGFLGAVGIAFAGAAAYGGLVASVLARYNDEAFEATEASNAFTRALDSIKATWNGIVDQNIDKIFMQMGQAIYTAQFALEGLTPFINQVVDAMTRMTNELKSFVQESPTMLRFFDNMNSKGTAVFENIIRGLGRFGQGLIDMVNAAMPLIEWVAEGFNNLGTQFSEWASRMAETNGFHEFISYVQENMPKIGKIFGDFFLGVIDLFAAFGENSSTVLDGLQNMVERFREWSSTIKESDGFQKFIDYIQTNAPAVVSLIGNIVMMVVNFATAMAPIAQIVLNVVTSITAWIAELFKAHPIIAQIIGVIITLAGIFMMLVPAILAVTKIVLPFIGLLLRIFNVVGIVKGAISLLGTVLAFLGGPISIVIAGIVALVAGFIMLYQKVEGFRNIVNTVWEFVTTFIQERIALIIETFNQFREQGQGIFEAAWNTIVTIITEGLAQTWTAITTWISEVITAFVEWGTGVVESIRTALMAFGLIILTKLLEAKTAFTTWISDIITGIIDFGINLVTTITNALIQFATAILTNLTTAYNNFITWITNVITSIIQFGVNLVTTITTALVQFATAISTNLATAFTNFTTWIANVISSIISFGASIISSIVSTMASFVSTIVSGTASALSAIASFIASGISAIISFGAQIVSTIVSAMASFVSSIASGTASALSTIASFIASGISAIVSFGSQIVSTIVSAMAQFVSAIVSGGANAVSAVVSMGSQIVSSISGFVGDMVSVGGDLIRGLIDGIKSMAGAAVNAAKSVVGDAIAGAKNLLGINSPSRVFRSFGEYSMEGLQIGIQRMGGRAVSAVTDVAKDMTNSFAPNLTTTADIDGQIGNIGHELRNTVDADIQSGIEVARPQVNITVRNEGDIDMIRSTIEEMNAVDESVAFDR